MKYRTPLEQVVKFLNEQMPSIEVLAVEIKQFRGQSSQTLVPRVIGRTAAEPRTSFSSRSHERVDMEPYMDLLRSGRPGETLKWTLGEGEIVRRAKRRLTIAANDLGMDIRNQQTTPDVIEVAVLTSPEPEAEDD